MIFRKQPRLIEVKTAAAAAAADDDDNDDGDSNNNNDNTIGIHNTFLYSRGLKRF